MGHKASEVMEAVLGRSAGSSHAVVVVGLDFGTTFSGYAYCHKDDPEKIFMFYEWPEQASGGGQPYCKTQTSLYYAADAQGKLQLASWGWPASVEYRKAMSKASPHKVGHLVTLFKLNLASSDRRLPAESRLPAGLTAKKVITDYLREISRSIFAELRNRYGNLLRMHEVQWCLTVPTLWDDHAKQCMKTYAEEAGLVVGRSQNPSSEASRHTLEIVLEPEAAAVYCLSKLKHQLSIEEHDMFLTADIGGGTVDIVVHKKLNTNSDLQLKEVVRSTGELCGGSFVDERFLEHMSSRIGCLPEFLKENPVMELAMRRWWGETKSTFNGTTSATYPVPGKLCRAWEGYDRRRDYKPCLAVDCRDEVELTVPDLCQIFDPVVDDIVRLIAAALEEVRRKVKVIMAVGGFAASPYLMKKLRDEFTIPGQLEVVSPPDPGSAVCQGAAILGNRLGRSTVIVSRVCRKTYGVCVNREFTKGDRAVFKVYDEEGAALCTNVFDTFVRNGDSIPVDHCVTRVYFPHGKSEHEMEISVYSTSKRFVRYVEEGKGVKEEHKFMVDISAGMQVDRKIEVTMCFGGTSISVTAKGVNFEAHGAAEQAVPLILSDGEKTLPKQEQQVKKRKHKNHDKHNSPPAYSSPSKPEPASCQAQAAARVQRLNTRQKSTSRPTAVCRPQPTIRKRALSEERDL